MTRERAIEDLKTLKAFFADEYSAVPVSIEYAIEKLSKKGEWHSDDLFGNKCGWLCSCSVCKKQSVGETRYCPNCGARMVNDE